MQLNFASSHLQQATKPLNSPSPSSSHTFLNFQFKFEKKMDDFFGNPGAPKKLPLTGLCFSIAGMVDNISIMECRQLVIDNGANFYDTVSSGVTHLISSSDMEVVFDNEYKCQFFPTLRPQVAAVRFFQVYLLYDIVSRPKPTKFLLYQ